VKAGSPARLWHDGRPFDTDDGATTMNPELFEQGLAVRRQVLGDAYVNAALARANAFNQPLQEMVTEVAWGTVWTNDDLPLRTRSLINIGMLCALNRPHELQIHLRGALRNGCTMEEIRAVLLQVGTYCGLPAAVDGFRVATAVLQEEGVLPAERG
jgi:4-carboxymuconolactone decarboxylase